MICILNSKNAFTSLLNDYLNQQDVFESSLFPTLLDIKVSDKGSVIFFFDPFLDDVDNFKSYSSKVLDFCMKNKLKLIYFSSPSIYGHTEKTSVGEDEQENPFTKFGKEQKEFIENVKSSDINYLIIRIPDILEKDCNYFFNDFFNKKTTFIKWPGSTFINHEFIFSSDLFSAIKTLILGNAQRSEYNISGSKYTLEQICASLNEISGISVKISKISPFKLWMQSLNNKNIKSIKEMSYLYEKPIFLNSSRYEKEFGEIKKTDLAEGLYSIIKKIYTI